MLGDEAGGDARWGRKMAHIEGEGKGLEEGARGRVKRAVETRKVVSLGRVKAQSGPCTRESSRPGERVWPGSVQAAADCCAGHSELLLVAAGGGAHLDVVGFALKTVVEIPQHARFPPATMSPGMSLFSVQAVLILSVDDGSRIFAKYYSAPHTAPNGEMPDAPLRRLGPLPVAGTKLCPGGE